MTVTSTDILSTDDIAATIEERTETKHQFRRAFRGHDATSISSDSFTFPEWSADLDATDVSEVAELAEYPHADLALDGTTVTYTKYGFQVPIADEAVSDSRVSLALDRMGELARAEEAKLDGVAHGLLAANQNAAGPISSATDDFEVLVDAYTTLVDAGFAPEAFECYLSPQAWGQLAKTDQFNRATDQGDALARNGQLGEVFGMPVVLSNTGDLGASDGLIVDTSRYGYESTRWPTEVTVTRDEDRDADVYKIRTRKGFAVTNADAALALDFSGA